MRELTEVYLNKELLSFSLREVNDHQVLKDYFKQEKNKLSKLGLTNNNSTYLSYIEEHFPLIGIYILYDSEDDVAAFCLIPKYSPESLMRIYVTMGYRRLGLATFLINYFKIETLSCLHENTNALIFYEKIGFKVDNETPFLKNLKKVR